MPLSLDQLNAMGLLSHAVETFGNIGSNQEQLYKNATPLFKSIYSNAPTNYDKGFTAASIASSLPLAQLKQQNPQYYSQLVEGPNTKMVENIINNVHGELSNSLSDLSKGAQLPGNIGKMAKSLAGGIVNTTFQNQIQNVLTSKVNNG